MNTKKIGAKLIKLRGERTQEAVAKKLKISTSALSAYENGERIPRDSIKIKIAKFYEKSVQEIFFD